MKFPKNVPFTCSDILIQEPKLSLSFVEKNIRSQIRKGKLFIIGKLSQGDKKHLAFSDAPLHKLKDVSVAMVESISNELTLSQRRFLKRVFTKETLREILLHTEGKVKRIERLHDGGARTGLMSDNFSTRLGTSLMQIIKQKFGMSVEISGKNNRKSDLYFPSIDFKVEIKATAGTTSWLGGKWSDRPYPTLVVSYSLSEGKYFVALIPKIEWPKIKDGFYGPPLTWRKVRDEYPEKSVLFGGIGLDGKMVREKL